jgi:hypothetical protein
VQLASDHTHHAWVHEPIDGIKLHVDEATVPQPSQLMSSHWLDNRPLLKDPS